MNAKSKRLLSYAIKIIVSIAAIYFLLQKVPYGEIFGALRKTNIWLFFLSLGLYFLSQVVSTFRLSAILKHRNIVIDFLTNFKLYLVGMSYNLFLPGGVGGDGYKIMWISRRYIRTRKKIFTIVLLDRLSGLLVIVLIALLLLDGFVEHKYSLIPILAVPVVYFIPFLVVRKVLPQYKGIYHLANAWSFGVQVIQVLCVLVLGWALGAQFEVRTLALLFLASSIATAIPVFLGGIGAREVVFGFLAVQLQMDESQAISIALLFSLITLISSVPGLFLDWHLNPRKKTSE